MKSTMQATPLLISSLLRHGTTIHGDSEVVTWTAEGPRRMSYRQVGQQKKMGKKCETVFATASTKKTVCG